MLSMMTLEMMKKMTKLKISLKKVVGKKYNRFWHFKGRYRVVKGSRASKKSKTTALWHCNFGSVTWM